MKLKYTLALGTVTGAFLISTTPVQASTDSRIEDSAKNSYVFKTYLKDDSVHVKSKDGVVTLTGTVADDSQKTLAADTVASLPGVINVDNELQVSGDMPANHTDKWLELKVKSALLFHRNVSAATKVTAVDGIVTLQGQAVNPEQKELTTEYARDVDGVSAVHNEMVVGSSAPVTTSAPITGSVTTTDGSGQTVGEKIDDASVTAEVKAALLSHHSTSALDTKVKTHNGVVYLSGIARSPEQKDLTTKIVSDIDGVRRVANHMRVEAPVSQ